MRSDYSKLGKKIEEVENLFMEIETEADQNPEMKVVHEEFANNAETIRKFKKDVARFLLITEKLDKNLVDLLVPCLCTQQFEDEAVE